MLAENDDDNGDDDDGDDNNDDYDDGDDDDLSFCIFLFLAWSYSKFVLV